MIGMQMSGFQDIYEVTENLGEPSLNFFNKMLFLICNCHEVSFLLHGSILSISLKKPLITYYYYRVSFA